MALTAKNMPYKEGFGPFAPEVYRVPMSYPYRDGGLTGAQAAAKAFDIIATQVGAANVAAVLIEPIQGEGGFVVPADGFLPAIAAWCKDNGALLIADEIQTGFCRTGAWFAAEHENVVPDLVTTAKGIGAIATMRDLDLPGAARNIETIMKERLGAMQARHDVIGDIRGRGAMIAIELVRPGTIEPNAALAGAIAKACHAEGVVVLTAGTYGNVLRFLPPLVIPPALLNEGLDVIESVIDRLAS
jgi:4-aminobutyrate aminotransferase/(S)-3-amino-2-methylpropionate transaminase